MKTFSYLSHTADVRMKVKADSAEELFEVALEGMNKIIKAGKCKQQGVPVITKSINLTSQNITTLLIEFLGEVLTLSQLHKALFCKLHIDQLSNNEISGSVTGYGVVGFDEDIKAVTYHEADVHRNAANQYETIIVFDT